MLSLPRSLANPDALKAIIRSDLLIGGAWRLAAESRRIDVVDPATEQAFASVANATIDDGLDAVAAAYDAGPKWAATAPRQRAEILRKAFELMMARAEPLAQLISLENGKALPDARGEVAYAAEFFRWFSEEAVRLSGELYMAPAGGNNRILTLQQPIGVSVLVTPWNFPAAMATRKIGPALAAGCTVVLKPATETPLTAYAIAAILEEAGVPPGVVNVLTTSRAGAVVSAMLHDPRVRKLSFTGSTEVGRRLLKEAADQVINCSMELGGNAPFLVFEDADIGKAIDGAMLAKMRNGGEACTAANRFYVHDSVHDAFARGFAERMGALKVGPGYEEGTQLGPMVNRDAVDRISGLVDDAVERGARILVGGKPEANQGYYFPATVLADVPPDARIMREEIFGPVAPLARFSTTDQAIERANDTEFGLISYLFTQDMKRGMDVAERLEAGMVGLNRGLVSDPAAPFGGVKQSGLGREGAHHGILEFSELKYIGANW